MELIKAQPGTDRYDLVSFAILLFNGLNFLNLVVVYPSSWCSSLSPPIRCGEYKINQKNALVILLTNTV